MKDLLPTFLEGEVYFLSMDPGFLMELLIEYTYILMAPAIFLFGPIVSLTAGVLLRLEVVALVPTCLALAAGELGSDVLWYWIGKRYGDTFINRFGRYFGITQKSVGYVKDLFDKHHDLLIFTSKITAGFGFATAVLFTAGLLRAPFGRFMMLNVAGQFLWTAGMLSIGYFLGHIYLKVGNIFEKMALFALMALVLASLFGFTRYLRHRNMQANI